MTNAINIQRYRGDTYGDSFTVKQNGSAVNITGYSFILSLSQSENPTGDDYVYQLTGSIDDSLGGVVSFAPNSTQANQAPRKYFYDVQMTDSHGAKTTIAKGSYTYLQDITKD